MTMPTPQPGRDIDDEGREPWRPRSAADLLLAQLAALDLWHRRVAAASTGVSGQSREARLDDARRRDIADREREALLAWAESSTREAYRFGAAARPRAVVAHRNDWLRGKICTALHEQEVEIVASTGDGAEACAAVVFEQPDILFVEDLLPTLTGVDVIRRARLLAPEALIGGHTLGQSGVRALMEAGARAAFSRRIPPAEVAAELMACLHGRHSTLTLV